MRRSSILITAVTVLVPLACGNSTAPTMESVAGTYSIRTFTVQEGTTTTDLLAGGGFIWLTLSEGGATAGHVFVPGGGEDGGDLDEDLTGTWTLTGTRVSLDHEADTFLRDMTFIVSGTSLSGAETFGEVTITVMLDKGGFEVHGAA